MSEERRNGATSSVLPTCSPQIITDHFKGWLIGPQFIGALEERLGADRLAIQGVEYPAAIVTNVIPSGASPEGVRNLRDLLNEANQRCPDSILLASGYSQGAAIVHKVFEDGLSASVKQQIAGIVLFGDTRRLQTGGRIAGYPADRTLVICNVGDLVCVGTLVITPAHIGYPARVPEAVDFMEARIQAVAI